MHNTMRAKHWLWSVALPYDLDLPAPQQSCRSGGGFDT